MAILPPPDELVWTPRDLIHRGSRHATAAYVCV